jgi:endosialidase-like protein
VSETDAGGAAVDGREQADELVNPDRREVLARFAKYTAPAMLALLVSTEESTALVCLSACPSDIRLKRDVTPIGRVADGINLYRYRYLWSDTIQLGVMAHEVAATRPEAVHRGTDGYLRVDYARLGLRVQTWDGWLETQPIDARARKHAR